MGILDFRDRKRKKFVSTNGTPAKKIKTESGNYIAASYKTHVYLFYHFKNSFTILVLKTTHGLKFVC